MCHQPTLPRTSIRSLGAAGLWLTLLVCLAPGARGQSSNDTYLPRSRAAEEALARGDQAWLSRADDPGAERAALESWFAALVESDAGDAVRRELAGITDEPFESPWLDPAYEDSRRSESVELAVRRRLTQVGDEARASWRARFGELAAGAAAGEGSSEWERAVREHPGTLGAFRAALRLAEQSLEEGRRLGTESWLERAQVQLDLGAGGASEREALQRRRDLVPRVFGAAPDMAGEADVLRGARGLELRGQTQLAFTPGGRPGLVRLSHGQLLVQGRGFDRGLDIVWEADDGEKLRPFEPWKLLDEQQLLYGESRRSPGDDWDYQPLADGASLLLILGRAEDLRGFEERSNTVARLIPPSGPEPGALEWALGPSGLWIAGEGLVGSLESVIGPGLWEFQPEPLLIEDRLVLQARQWKQELDDAGRLRLSARGEARAWAIALDRRTGRPLWKRELGRGSEPRTSAANQMAATRRARTPAAPPVLVAGHRVFCATQLGVGSLLDLEDGRLTWSYLNPRRSADSDGWSAQPAPRAVTSASGGPPTIVWAPADGDRLLWLRGDADPAGEGLELYPPLAREEAEALLGADAQEALILARYGPRYTLAAYRPQSGERLDAIDLGRGESPLADLLWSGDRALFASDRALYLFDRTRELYLLEALPLPYVAEPGSGRLLTRKGSVQLLLPSGLFSFAVLR